jgi:hypothetical protein
MTHIREQVLTLILLTSFLTLGTAALQPVLADQLTLVGCNGGAPVTVTSGSATLPCSYTVFGLTVNSTETGNLALGTSGVTVSATNPNSPLGGGSGTASVEVTYVFNVSGASNGTAQFDLTGTGTFSATPNGNSLMEFEYQGGPWSINGVSQPTSATHLGSASTLALDAPIVNGTATVSFLENAEASVGGLDTGTSTTDFFDPFSITGASAFDSNGNPVSATFVSESGFNPNAGVVPTPEPSSIVLVLAGCAAMVLMAFCSRLA